MTSSGEVCLILPPGTDNDPRRPFSEDFSTESGETGLPTSPTHDYREGEGWREERLKKEVVGKVPDIDTDQKEWRKDEKVKLSTPLGSSDVFEVFGPSPIRSNG